MSLDRKVISAALWFARVSTEQLQVRRREDVSGGRLTVDD
jgi:hypothetical protein